MLLHRKAKSKKSKLKHEQVFPNCYMMTLLLITELHDCLHNFCIKRSYYTGNYLFLVKHINFSYLVQSQQNSGLNMLTSFYLEMTFSSVFPTVILFNGYTDEISYI